MVAHQTVPPQPVVVVGAILAVVVIMAKALKPRLTPVVLKHQKQKQKQKQNLKQVRNHWAKAYKVHGHR